MNVLAIETSCDESAVAILSCEGDETSATFSILGNGLISQIDQHREFGGVFPSVAKRHHARNLVPLLESALEEAELLHEDTQSIAEDMRTTLSDMLAREPELGDAFFAFVSEVEKPAIDAIVVTAGPGLEPALWVGVNFAQALSKLWNIPLVPVNHMEGHFLVALAQQGSSDRELSIQNISLPALGLLISGGHTEFDLMTAWGSYELLGQTLDDAVGEAFDKVGRMLGLPYPGGPEVGKLAARDREDSSTNPFTFPRPLLDRPDCNFSFSGLKTAVLYLLKEHPEPSEREKEQIARAFEDACADVLANKTQRALEQSGAKMLAIGGGVSASVHIRSVLQHMLDKEFGDVEMRIPPSGLTGDNAIMIGIAGYYRALRKEFVEPGAIVASGNKKLKGAIGTGNFTTYLL